MRVFVYGSLRKGAPNSFRMKGAQFIGRAGVRGYLYRIDWYPGIKLDNGADLVVGEIYDVPVEMMPALDEYEGAEYIKKTAPVEGCDDCREAMVWEYLPSVTGLELVEGGDWLQREKHL